MFESFKIRKLISHVISSDGQQNIAHIKALRQMGQPGLDALIFAYKSGKITDVDMERYLTVYYDKKLLDTFVDLLGDSKEQVRLYARNVIMARSGATALPALIGRLRNSDFLQRRGLSDLITKLGSPLILDKIIPLLGEKDRELKRVAMNIIADLGGSAASVYLLPLLKSDDWWVRKRAVEVLSKVKDVSAVAPLLEQLATEKDPKIKVTIIHALGEVGDAATARSVLPHIADKDMVVRQMVVEAMEKIADSTIIPGLIEFIKDTDVNVRRAGAEIMDNIRDPKATETLIQCIQDKDWWVREIATDALSVLKTGGLTEKVLSLFTHKEENVRRAAVEFFNRAPDAAAFDGLIGILGDKDWWVREKAVAALGKLKREEAIPHISALIDDPDVRWVIPSALSDIGGAKGLEQISHLLSYPDRTVRIGSLKALGKLEAKEYLPKIKEAVKDSDAEVRDTALSVIKDLTGRTVRASQILEEEQRKEVTGENVITSAPLPGNVKIMSEAILVLDLCNSTGIAANYGDEFAFKLTERLVKETRPVAVKNGARFTKSTGDGFLMTFATVQDAVSFAKEIMQTIHEGNGKVPENERIDIRIAINMGETRVDAKGDRLGTAVNMTFRVEGVKPENLIETQSGMKAAAMPLDNRILITEPVHEAIAGKNGGTSRLVGFFELKGISGRHRIFQLA